MGAADGYLTNKLYRDVASLLTGAGIEHRVELGGRHWFVVFTIGERTFRQVLHLGPGNKRSTERKTLARFKKIVAMRDQLIGGTPAAVTEIEPEHPLGVLASVASPADVVGSLRRIEYRGQPVVTFAMIDALHGRPEGTARRQFNANRHRFVDGADVVTGNLDEIRSAFPGAVGGRGGGQVNLITRRGYMKLVKGFNDDRAWAVMEEMVDRYFVVEQVMQAPAVVDAGIPVGLVEAFKAERAALLGGVKAVVGRALDGHQMVLAERVKMVDEQVRLGVERILEAERRVYRAIMAGASGAVALQAADYIEIGSVYGIANVTAAVPAKGRLSAMIRSSLISYCAEKGIAARSAFVGGRPVLHWPRATVIEWMDSRGRRLIADHFARHGAKPVVRAA
jgi:hypothetical protein